MKIAASNVAMAKAPTLAVVVSLAELLIVPVDPGNEGRAPTLIRSAAKPNLFCEKKEGSTLRQSCAGFRRSRRQQQPRAQDRRQRPLLCRKRTARTPLRCQPG